MHTLYKIYGKDNEITGFVIDDVPATQNFNLLDRGPLSYLQSIVDNLNAYIKKNGSLTDDSDYIIQVQHGQFDLAYGAIEDKRTENPNYPSETNSNVKAGFKSEPVAEPKTLTVTVPGTQMPSPDDNSTADVKSHNEPKDEPLPADAAKEEAPQDEALKDDKSKDDKSKDATPKDDKSQDTSATPSK